MKLTKKALGRLGAILLALVMCLSMLPTMAFAEGTDESKTLTVGVNETYTTVQQAINAIYAEEDPTDWTIEVESGDYAPFAIPKELDGLTVEAATGASVTIHTWNDSYVNSEYGDAGFTARGEYLSGVYVNAEDVTIEGIDFEIGTAGSGVWYKSGIHDVGTYAAAGTVATGLTVKDCSFSADDGVTTTTEGVINCSSTCTVTGCKFEGLTFAVYILGDNTCANGVSITYNTFTDCENACVIYYGGGLDDGADGTITFSYNTVTGSADQYSSVAIEDLNDLGSITTVIIEGNTFVYSVIGLVAVPSDAYDSLSENNNCDEYSIGIYTAISSLGATNVEFKFLSPSEDEGYWVFDETVFESSSSIYQDSDAAKEAIEAAIAEANAASSRTLTVTLDMTGYPKQLIENNCILWVSGTMPSEKVDLPGLDKVIVLEDGTEVDQDDVAAGSTVNYKLASTVPDVLADYIDYTYSEDGAVGKVTEGDTYTLTFHDVMDESLSYNGDIAVYIGSEKLDAQYYTVTTSGLEDDCTFEITMDLLALYTADIIDEDDFGKTAITVTYSATLDEGASAGAYYNTAWVVYPNGESEEDKVEVDTYGIKIFKYDQSTAVTDDEGNTTYTGLEGATFGLYSDESCDDEYLITTLTSGTDGYVTYEGLDAGTYYLKEIEAPEGYVKADTVLPITLADDVDAETYLANVSFANAPIPSTGGAGTTMYTIAGICILLAAGAIFMITRRKRNAE